MKNLSSPSLHLSTQVFCRAHGGSRGQRLKERVLDTSAAHIWVRPLSNWAREHLSASVTSPVLLWAAGIKKTHILERLSKGSDKMISIVLHSLWYIKRLTVCYYLRHSKSICWIWKSEWIRVGESQYYYEVYNFVICLILKIFPNGLSVKKIVKLVKTCHLLRK